MLTKRLISLFVIALTLAACGASPPATGSGPAPAEPASSPLPASEPAPAAAPTAPPTEAPPAPAATEATISVEPPIARAGDTVTIRAAGFDPGEEISYLASASDDPLDFDITRLNADESGAVSIEVAVTETTSVAYHYVLLSGQASKLQLTGGFDVTRLAESELAALQATAIAPASATLPLTVVPPAMGRKVRMSFTAEGFMAGEAITFFLLMPSGPFSVAPLGAPTADQAGRVTALYDFQANLRPLEPGTWRARLIGAQSGRVAEGMFSMAEEVLAPVPENAPTITPLPTPVIGCEAIEELDVADPETIALADNFVRSPAFPAYSFTSYTEILWARKIGSTAIIAVRTADGDPPPGIFYNIAIYPLYFASLDKAPDALVAEAEARGIAVPRALVDLEQCPLP